MSWHTEGKKSSPSSGTLLADTGVLTQQEWSATILLSGTVTAKFKLQHRNAANDGNVVQHELSLIGSQPFATPILRIGVAEDDERIRVVSDGLILGDVQASIFLG